MKIFKILIFLFLPITVTAQKSRLDSLSSQLKTNSSYEQLDKLVRQLITSPNGDSIATKFVNEQLIHAKKAEDLKQEAKFILLLSIINTESDNYSMALQNCVDGVRISKSLNDTYYLSRFFRRLGLIYAYEKDHKKSGLYFRLALEATVLKRDTALILNIYSSLETHYVVLKKLDSARYFAELEYKLANSLKNEPIKNNAIISSLMDLGEVENALNRPDSALFYYLQVIRFKDYHHFTANAPGFFEKNIAATYLKLGQLDSAKKYALIGYQKTSANKNYGWMAEAAETLSKAYEGNDYPKSLFYYKAAVGARDTLNSGMRTQRFQAEENREKQIEEEFKKSAAAYQAKVRVYSVITILAFLSIVSFILLVAYRKQQKGNKLLKSQKLEIEAALLKLQATQQQLIQSEKMASLGELTAGIAHEIQNPLNFVNNFSEVSVELTQELKHELKSGNTEEAVAIADDLEQNLGKINHHGKRADAIVKGMLQHSQLGSGTKEPVNINSLADEYMRLAYHGLRAKDKDFNVELITSYDEKLPKVNMVPQDMGRVMLNLFNNAFYAVNQKLRTAGAGYKPEVAVTTSAENGHVIIGIKDNGIGIPDAIKEKIMQPFFTTKPTGEGTGLGLSLTYDMVVKGHGGTLEIVSKEGEGSEFIVKLPLN